MKLEPPVNRVLPIARGREKDLFEAYSGLQGSSTMPGSGSLSQYPSCNMNLYVLA